MTIRPEPASARKDPLLLVPLTPRSALAGPASEVRGQPSALLQAVTGGGMVAILDRSIGLRSIWSGRTFLGGPLVIEIGASRAEAEGPFHSRDGAWTGRYRLPTGDALVETGLLSDAGGAVALQWKLQPGASSQPPASGDDLSGSPVLSLGVLDGHGSVVARAELPIAAGKPACLAIVPPGGNPERVVALLAPLAAREKQRRGRARGDAGIEPFGVELDGQTVRSVDTALRRLDDAALDVTTHGPSAGRLFLGSVSPEGPSYLEGSALAELGLAALVTGRRGTAANVLGLLAEFPPSSPRSFLYLAAQHTLWTGSSEAVAALTPALEAAAEIVRAEVAAVNEPGGAGEGRAPFPAGKDVLALLRFALEPFGSLGPLAERRAEHGPPVRSHPDAELPMVAPGPGGTASARPRAERPRLEPFADVRAFSERDSPDPDEEGILRPVRLLRAWVGGQLRVEPDASYGRVRLAPRVNAAWRSLDVRGLAVADATLHLQILSSPGSHELRVAQEGGRVPLNVVFTPWLPLRRVRQVRMGDRLIGADVAPAGKGSRIQLQFPLDGPRAVTVTGDP